MLPTTTFAPGGVLFLLIRWMFKKEAKKSMDVRRDSFVIAINGASGSGKSTLVKALVQELGNAVAMYFDDYDPRIVPSSKYPTDISQWINNGADPNKWETPQLVEDPQRQKIRLSPRAPLRISTSKQAPRAARPLRVR